ncbi:cation transporter [candidate division KSB1 bacterium]|nr:cation transporter [candidate division KSB1 bacterium]
MAVRESGFQKALRLEYFTIIYNFLEAGAAIIAGKISGSISLIGFGLDSIVENTSGFILIWRLKKHGSISKEEEERIEQRASRFVGISFFLLGAYIAFESIQKIWFREVPEKSLAGIIIASLSLIIMPLLARAKLKLGLELNLKSLVADSKETLVCAWMSLALLLGLLTHTLFGFWLADPIVGLIIVGFLFKEGYELFFEEDED